MGNGERGPLPLNEHRQGECRQPLTWLVFVVVVAALRPCVLICFARVSTPRHAAPATAYDI